MVREAAERRVAGILVQVAPERRQAIFDEVERLSTASQSFFLLVAVSTIIAAYGLLANSIAVVIGAMLVAPLMGLIFGVALGLSVGDQRLLGRSLLSEIAGMALVVVMAVLIGLIPVRLGFGSEFLARTQPTVYDIVIALASGIAGSYALVDERLNAALPGVAISVSLVPPLATCGLSLAAMRYEWALGAFLLFVANFLAIHVVSAMVFIVFGVKNIRVYPELTVSSFFRRFTLSLLALAVVAVFLTQTLLRIWDEHRFAEEVQTVLSYQVRSRVGAQLSEFKLNRSNHEVEVLAVVLTPHAFEPAQVAQIEKALRQQIDLRIELVLRSLISKDYGSEGPAYVPKEELEQRAKVDQHTSFLKKVSDILHGYFIKIPGAHLVELRLDHGEDHTVINAVVRSHNVIKPAQVANIEAFLQQAVKEPVHLVVRSVLTKDANPHHFLYEPHKTPKHLSGEALKFHQKLEKALKEQLKNNVDGAILKEFRYGRRDGRLLLLAMVRAPQNISPFQVSQIQEALRQQVDPDLSLVVRSVVGVDTSDTRYLPGLYDTLLPQTDDVKIQK